jgi:AAA15 family ATPase/GTPase
MIEQITIENFKSLKAVTLKLQPVNLLIGPNNSGKSNFLKGMEYFKNNIIPNGYLRDVDFLEFTFKKKLTPQRFEFIIDNSTLTFSLNKKGGEFNDVQTYT